jgi:hypothetical protein
MSDIFYRSKKSLNQTTKNCKFTNYFVFVDALGYLLNL